MRKFPSWLIAFTISFFACAALAQSAVKITAVDPTTGANGTLRNVIVDSQGRLVVVTSGASDGGTGSSTAVYPASCSDVRNITVTLVSGVVTAATTTGLQWIRVCNSLRNTGSPLVTCASDSNGPSTSASGRGDVLAPGDCMTVPANPNGVSCISDDAANINFTRCYQ